MHNVTTIKQSIIFIVLCCFLAAMHGCGSPVAKVPVGDRSLRQSWIPKTHKVRPGDTLFSIAWAYGLNYHDIARWNGLLSPYKIVVGQTLHLRKRSYVAPARTNSKSESSKTPINKESKAQAKTAMAPAKKTPPVTASVVNHSGPVRWRWPAEGKIVRRFQSNSPGKKGINIAGRSGQPVKAAAAGRVVYSGSGLVGYGRLIIIKHNKNFLSAYGHNRRLLVKEGEQVQAGQLIAEMGSSGTNKNQLHFEVRMNGKPVDPLRYLPRR